MVNLSDIKSTIFDKESIIAEVYKNGFYQYKTMAYPYKEEMKNANQVIIFIDNDNNITGGQISKYNTYYGLNTILFDGKFDLFDSFNIPVNEFSKVYNEYFKGEENEN